MTTICPLHIMLMELPKKGGNIMVYPKIKGGFCQPYSHYGHPFHGPGLQPYGGYLGAYGAYPVYPTYGFPHFYGGGICHKYGAYPGYVYRELSPQISVTCPSCGTSFELEDPLSSKFMDSNEEDYGELLVNDDEDDCEFYSSLPFPVEGGGHIHQVFLVKKERKKR